MNPEALRGVKVVSFESRMADAMTRLLEKYGATPLSAPSMQEIPLEQNHDIIHAGELLSQGQIDIMICLTGVGVRALMEGLEKRYSKQEILNALADVFVVTRGPKPVRVLREYGISAALKVSEPNTWREIIQELDEADAFRSLKDKVIAVQEYGETNESLIEALKRRGAKVVRIPVYRWAFPNDTRPLKEGIEAVLKGEAQVALFTNKTQVDHVMRLATEEGRENDLRKAFRSVVVASIGPICTEGLLGHGVSVDIEPEESKIGPFVSEIASRGPEILKAKRKIFQTDEVITFPMKETPPADSDQKLQESPFLRACRRQKTPFTPIWLMRQAGRYMKEYRDIRRRRNFIDLCKDKDLVTEITVTAQEYLGVDAAIIFSDILLIVEALGMELEYTQGEGPVIRTSLSEGLRLPDVKASEIAESMDFLTQAIRRTRASLKPHIPLIGFTGAPFTLASYMIEGGPSKNFLRTKSLMYQDPEGWKSLMTKISDAVGASLQMQIKAGVQAVQIFDTWVGCLGPEDYRSYAAPFTKRALKGISAKIPVIHFGLGAGAFLKDLSRAGGDVIGVDYRMNLKEAWKTVGYRKAVQGNLDPLILLADRKVIRGRVRSILKDAGGRAGHIFNLGHGILPQTPPEHARYLVELVHELSC